MKKCFLEAIAAAVDDDGVVVVRAAVEYAVAAVDDEEEELAGFEAAPASLAAAVVAGADAERGPELENVERQVQSQALALQRNPAQCCCNRSQMKYPVAFRVAAPQQGRRRAPGS